MIHIDRSRVPIPEALLIDSNPSLQKESEQAEVYFRSPEQNRSQNRFMFRTYTNRSVKIALRKLFHNKCCYCEVKLDRIQAKQKYGLNGDIEHFRPKSSVLEVPDHSGYWWLASDWNNLLIACQRCNRGSYTKGGSTGKANRFPLENEKDRAYYPEDNLSLEKPLLLDPTIDQPAEHLIFSDDGRVYSDSEKGKTSILVYGLNRSNLVEDRKAIIEDIRKLYNTLRYLWKNARKLAGNKKEILSDPEIRSHIRKLNQYTEAHEEYAGLKRQYVRHAFERLGILKEVGNSSIIQPTRVSHTRKKSAKKAYQSYKKNLESISIASDKSDRKEFLLLNHYVEKIELKNIKTFEHQVFDLTSSNEATAPWMMLLGENGAGKSTVLKSLAMNLSDSEYFIQMMQNDLIRPNRFIRHRCTVGTIKVWLTGMSSPRTLELRNNHYIYTSPDGEKTEIKLEAKNTNSPAQNWKAHTFLLGYGATRLLPRNSKHEDLIIPSKYLKVDNLFNPFVPLGDAEKWLKSLNPKLFRRAALIFKDLLNMDPEENLIKEKGTIMVHINGSKMPFHEMSDGYQSVVALTADVLKLAMTEWENPDEARGIVMLDEVGAHLHPQWKMRIVGSLRKALPHMQFIVSSHQPLCLRGLGAGEVMILRRNSEKKVEVLTDLPNPKDLRISQILTSVFGLSSTLDPELEKEYNRYFELRALHERTDEEQEEMDRLKNQLSPDMMIGDSLLDAQTYKVVKEQYDDYKKSEKQSDVETLTNNTLTAVQALWKKKS